MEKFLKQIFMLTLICLIAFIQPFLVRGQELDVQKEKKIIRTALEELDKNLKDKNLEQISKMFSSDKDTFYIGLDGKEKAEGGESLRELQKSQSQNVRILELQTKELNIAFENAQHARYIRTFDIYFVSGGLRFVVEDVRETGVFEKKGGLWIIVQQHASAPVTDSIWPFYLARNRADLAEYKADRKFRIRDLKEDFDLLRLALEEAHPGMYRYTSKAEFDALFLDLDRGIVGELTEIEFFRWVCPVIEKIHCVHTSISPSSDCWKHMEENETFFPLRVKFIGNSAFAVQNLNPGQPVTQGSRILSINRRPMAKLTAELLSMFPSDGKNETYKYRILDRDFAEKYGLYIGQPDWFEVEYIPTGKKAPVTETLPGVTYRTLEQSSTSFEAMYSQALKLDFIEDLDTALLTIKTFVPRILDHFGFEFEVFVQNAFQKIEQKNVRNLVIDLRDNDGGDGAYGALLLSHLIKTEVRTTEIIDTPQTRYSFLEYTDKGLFFNWFHPRLWTRGESGRYVLKGNWRRTVEPQAPHFDGQVFILINGMSISATSGFAALAHRYELGEFVGEETGGAYNSDNGGEFLNLTLPRTKLRVRIPVRGYTLVPSDYPYPDRGIIPDFKVSPSIEDILQNKDAVLDFTLNLIQKKRG